MSLKSDRTDTAKYRDLIKLKVMELRDKIDDPKVCEEDKSEYRKTLGRFRLLLELKMNGHLKGGEAWPTK